MDVLLEAFVWSLFYNLQSITNPLKWRSICNPQITNSLWPVNDSIHQLQANIQDELARHKENHHQISKFNFDELKITLGEEIWYLIGGVSLAGFVDGEVFPTNGLPEAGHKLVAGHVDLGIKHQVSPVSEHLHHRSPYPVQPPSQNIVCHLCHRSPLVSPPFSSSFLLASFMSVRSYYWEFRSSAIPDHLEWDLSRPF